MYYAQLWVWLQLPLFVQPVLLSGGGFVFLFSVYSSVFLLVFGLLSIVAALYYFLWFSRGCGRVPQCGSGSGWAPVPFVVYPPSYQGGWFHTTS